MITSLQQLGQNELELKGEILLAERNRTRLIDDIGRLQKLKEKENEQYSKQIGALTAQLKQLENLVAQLKKEHADLSPLVEQIKQDAYTYAERTYQETKTKCDQLESDIQERQKALRSWGQQLQLLQEQTDRKQQEVTQKNIEVEKEKTRIAEERKKLDGDAERFFSDYQVLERQANDLRSTIERLEQEQKDIVADVSVAKEIFEKTVSETTARTLEVEKRLHVANIAERVVSDREKELKTWAEELRTKEAWLTDREQTQTRAFAELQRNKEVMHGK